MRHGRPLLLPRSLASAVSSSQLIASYRAARHWLPATFSCSAVTMKLGRTALPIVAILVITAALNMGTSFAEEEATAESPTNTPGDDAEESTTRTSTTSSNAQAAADAEQQEEHRPEEDWGSYYDPKGEFCGEYDCYSILGFDYESFGRSPPDTKEITQAYRLLSRKWHPDKQRGKNKDFAEERFVKINKAHKVLTNKRRRKEYDYLRDRPDEYIHKYGTNVQYSYAPKSDVVMVMLILLIVGNLFTYYVQKNRWQTVADHVVKLALEGATLRDGGSDESVAIREKALEILAKQKEEAGTTGPTTATATRRGSSGSAKGPSPTKKAKGGAKATKKEQKEQEMEELRPIVVKLVQEEHKDFGGGFHQPTWRDLLITKMVIQWPVQFAKATSWQLGYWGRRLRGVDLTDDELEVLTRRAVGEITWHSLSDEDRVDACTQELWISTNLEDWREMQEVKKLGAGYQKKYNRWKRKQGSKLE